jgi:hypothetical protein
MKISFIIITDGKKIDKTIQQIKSIEKLSIDDYEIVLCGNCDSFVGENVKRIDAKHFAEAGSLGGMRNLAVHNSIYNNVVISDDDMLFPEDWYQNFSSYEKPFDILTTRILAPDGTRFWDHCCYMSPTHGHVVLNPDEEDDYLYMSGGQSWIMKKYVWDKVKWDESVLIYACNGLKDYKDGKHNEDTLFSLQCREAGFKISHDPNTTVIHNDKSYTAIGRIVRRRVAGNGPEWCDKISVNKETAVKISEVLFSSGYQAEALDILRKYNLEEIIDFIESRFGGKLDGSRFSYVYN